MPAVGGAVVRRSRRSEARPLVDLSDFHPAEVSDFGPALTPVNRALKCRAVKCVLYTRRLLANHMRRRISLAVGVLLVGVNAWAQSPERASFGATVTFVHLPQPGGDQPEGVFPYVEAPYGNSSGWEIFGDFAVSRRLSIGGELAIASPVSLTTVESHSSNYTTRTMEHRDTILVGLLRVRTVPFLDVVAGGGLVSARTSLTVSGWTSGVSGGQVPFGPLNYQSPSNGTRPALTVGADLAVPLHRHFSLLGIVRLHHLSRAEPLHSTPFGRSDDPRPFVQPSAHVIRLGVGGRLVL
jgi:hypothetical protein